MYLFDFLVGRRDYDMFAAETLGILFSTGVGLIHPPWVALGNFMSHHPGVPLTELAALFHLVAGLPGNDFAAFRTFGMVVNILTVIAASAWGAALARRLDAPVLSLAVSSGLAALMPGVAAFSPSLTAYHTCGPLLLPTGLGILAVAGRKDAKDPAVMATYFMLGFLLSITHLAFIPLVAFILTVAVTLKRPNGGAIYQSLGAKPAKGWHGAAVRFVVFLFMLALMAFAGRVLLKLLTIQFGGQDSLYLRIGGMLGLIPLAALPALLATRMILRSPLLRPLVFGAGGTVLLGWAAGLNLYSLEWPMSVYTSFTLKGGGSRQELSLLDQLRHLDVLGFLTASPWHAVIPALLAIGVLAIVGSRARSAAADAARDRFLGIFLAILVGLNLLLALDASLLDSADRTYNVVSHYYNMLIMAIPPALVWLYRRSRRWGQVGTAAAAIILSLCLADYLRVVAPVASKNFELNAQASAMVKAHLAEHPDGEVLCYLNYIPDACDVAQAFWMLSLRDPALAQRLTAGRRVRAVWPTLDGELTDKPTLVITGVPLGSLTSRSPKELLSWSQPRGRTAMPTFLQVLYLAPAGDRS